MPNALHDTDFYAWTQTQAAALRRVLATTNDPELDIENIAEEIESLGRSEYAALTSALTGIIEHMLKLDHSPAAEPRRGWVVSVAKQRIAFGRVLAANPGLKPHLPAILADAWQDGRALAVAALATFDGVDPATVPSDCPYALGDVLGGPYDANAVLP